MYDIYDRLNFNIMAVYCLIEETKMINVTEHVIIFNRKCIYRNDGFF